MKFKSSVICLSLALSMLSGEAHNVVLANNQTVSTTKDACFSLEDRTYTAKNGIIYEMTDDTSVSVIGFKNKTKRVSVAIPAKVTIAKQDYNVTEIEDYAFINCKKLTVTAMPNTITRIGVSAFEGTSFSGKLSSSLTLVEVNAFKNCKAISKVVFPKNFKTLGECAFWGSTVSQVTFSDMVKEIPASAFRNAKKLTNVKLGAGVTKIGACAFLGCDNLKKINIPAKLNNIGKMAFVQCTKLAKPNVSGVKKVSGDAFDKVVNSFTSSVGADNECSYSYYSSADGYCHFVDTYGNYLKGQFVKWKKATYYVDEKGNMLKGWYKLNGKFYYFNRDDGKFRKSCTVDGLKLDKNGQPAKDATTTLRVTTMIKARERMELQSKPTDSKEARLRKCFDWVVSLPYYRHRILPEARQYPAWEATFACDVFDSHDGCCVAYSCSVAFLAKEIGYKDIYICDGGVHAWCEINGLVYDPLLAETNGYDRYYGGDPKRSGLAKYFELKLQ